MEIPPPIRVKDSSLQQTFTLEVCFNLYYKLLGYYSNPDHYLTSLVDYHKKTCDVKKVAIITGANSGIGYVTTDYLYRAGYLVILACRSENKAEEAMKQISKTNSDGELKFIQLDCNSLESVRVFVEKFEILNIKIDLLINNAGILLPPYQETQDGFESQMGVNYISHFYLTDLLIPHLNKGSKIINIGSICSFWSKSMTLDTILDQEKYIGARSYSQSKVALILFSYYLHEKYRLKNIYVYNIHPGAVATPMLRTNKIINLLTSVSHLPLKNSLSGTFTILRCALLPPEKDHGKESLYFCEETIFPPHKLAYTRENIEELVGWTREIIHDKGFEVKSFV